ncbi:MAG: MarR family [Labilithrix sp.]|nr:MarR family [Labilithrix sp.]
MHAMFFGIKLAHLRTLTVTRGLLRGRDLTPARFDMMRVIELHRRDGIAQENLRQLLGVSAPTVSRMLKSLELLGFVVRRRFAFDARSLIVRITKAGLERVRAARELLVDSGVADRMALRGLAFEPEVARPLVDTLRRFLSGIRKTYGCFAPFEHPWTTQEFVPLVFHTYVRKRLAPTLSLQ